MINTKPDMNNLSILLDSADYLMVETLDELETCIKFGLKDSTKILSFNPYVTLNKTHNVESPEKYLDSKYYKNLADITKNYSGEIYNRVYDFTKDRGLAQYLSYYLISIQNTLYKTAQILNLVKKSKLVITYPNFSQESINTSVNGNFYNFIECFNNVNTFQIPYSKIDQKQLGRDPLTNFWVRLKFEGLNSIFFRLLSILCDKFDKLWTGKRLVYSHENTLLKGTATYLFRNGFLIQKLQANINYNNLSKQKILDELIELTFPKVKNFQKSILDVNYKNKSSFYFYPLYKKYISDYIKAKSYWNKYFLKSDSKKIKACLIGTPRNVVELSYLEVAKKNSIVTASFQHAISKEISEDLLSIDVTYESNVVDNYFVYNREAAKNSKKSRYNIAAEKVVGLPEDMKKSLQKQKYLGSIPILYATTTLYCGNRGIPARSGSSDIAKANFEYTLIEHVLSKIPYKVHYKPYFSKRYAGPSFELELAKSKNNININYDEVDLRYIIGDSRVIITTRATSTIGWCVLSGRPVIYIENEDNRLNALANKAFKDNLFYFDVREKNWESKLRKFLSLPLNIIEEKWNIKEINRKKFINKFFGEPNTNAEKNSANIILQEIKKYN